MCHLVSTGTLGLVFQENRVGTFPALEISVMNIVTVWNGSKRKHVTDKQPGRGQMTHSQPFKVPTDHVVEIHAHTLTLV